MNELTIEIPKKIYVYNEPVNMCKSFAGLGELVTKELKRKVDTGDLFLFLNRRRTYVKILTWSAGGWTLYCRKLDAGYFDIEFNEKKTLSPHELQLLVNSSVAMLAGEYEAQEARA